MPTDAPLLDYATTWPRWYRRPLARRCFIILLLAATVGGAWWAWKSTPGERARYAYWKFHCERYSAPPDKLVYALRDAAAEATVLRSGGIRSPRYPADAYCTCPQEWLQVQKHYRPWLFPGVTAFLHDRTTPSGGHRLIAAEVGYDTGGTVGGAGRGGPTIGVWWVHVEALPTSKRPAAAYLGTGCDFDLVVSGKQDPTLCLFAGQPDLADSTHFTIGYIANGQPGTLDAKLRNDGSVILTAPAGPLTVEPPCEYPVALFIYSSD